MSATTSEGATTVSNPAFELIRTISRLLMTERTVLQVGEPFLAGDSAKLQVGTFRDLSNPQAGDLVTVELSAVQVTSDLTESAEAALQRTAGELVGLRHAIVQFAPESYRPNYAAVANFDEHPLRYVRDLERFAAEARKLLDQFPQFFAG